MPIINDSDDSISYGNWDNINTGTNIVAGIAWIPVFLLQQEKLQNQQLHSQISKTVSCG